MSQYGTDIKLVDRDVVFTPDGDLETIEGPALIAQDIAEGAAIAIGTLVWDKTAGSTIPLALNDVGVTPAGIVAELERLAIDDERVAPETVVAEHSGGGAYSLAFRPLGSVTPETLYFDLDEILGALK